MFASKSERKVHYSIRKFSIGVASVVVASLFLGGVVHAEEVRRGNNLTVTSSGDEVESHYQSILEKVRKSLEKDRHTQNVDLIKKLQDIKRTYLYNLKEKPEAELTSKTKKELDAAFEKFKKEPELTKKLAEAEKKVAEAEKKAKDQKEEDHRNYPTNTYKTIELEIAEAEVGVAKAELELAQAQVQIPQDTEKINAAKAKVEAAKSNVKKLEKIKSDIEKTYLYKLDNSTKKTPKPRVRRNSPEIKAKGRVKNYKEANIELSKYMTDLYKLDNSTKETPKSRVRRNSPQVGDSRELKETIDKAKETLSTYMVTRLTKLDPSVFWFADLLRESKESVEKYKRMFDEASSKENVENLVKEAKQEIEALVVKHKGREIDLERTKAKTVIAKYLTGLLDDIKKNLKKEQHINTVELIKKLGDIKRTYLYKLDESTQKAQLQELVTESQSKLDEAFSKFKNGLSSSSSSGSSTKPETPQPEKPEHQKPTTPAPDTKPSPQPEGKKPSVPDINQEKEKAKLAVATYMSKILDDIQKHHLQKEKHRQIVALIKELDELKKQALSEIDNVNTKVEIENTVHKIFADMDAVVTKFKKGLTQDTPKEPGNKKPSAPKPGMQPSPQPEVKPQLEKPKPEVKPQPEKPKPEVKPQLEKPKPEVKPQPEKPKPEVKPQLEKPKPEVKPQPEKPKPEVKPQPEKPKPEVKPQLEKPKPEVKPQLEKPKPDNSKPQADDKKPSTTNNLSKDKQPSNQASTNEKATNKPKKSLPSTGSISNLALEIAGLLTLAGATILAKKRMK
uniref:Pneumococcal surface protein C n=33 Tax=Streptococcus pneumoniae TaxID=1313 RepID=A0A1M4NJ12_STREE|nr:pneumococcal surface protein C [Streptococcus pneumoniae]